jgi:hypothetical protein
MAKYITKGTFDIGGGKSVEAGSKVSLKDLGIDQVTADRFVDLGSLSIEGKKPVASAPVAASVVKQIEQENEALKAEVKRLTDEIAVINTAIADGLSSVDSGGLDLGDEIAGD